MASRTSHCHGSGCSYSASHTKWTGWSTQSSKRCVNGSSSMDGSVTRPLPSSSETRSIGSGTAVRGAIAGPDPTTESPSYATENRIGLHSVVRLVNADADLRVVCRQQRSRGATRCLDGKMRSHERFEMQHRALCVREPRADIARRDVTVHRDAAAGG